MILLILLQMLYACVSITNKTLLGYCSPLVLAGIRMMIASFVLSVYACRNTHIFSALSLVYWPYYAYLIVCGVYAKYALTYWGLSNMPVVTMSCLFHTTPFIMAAISWLWDGEHFSLIQMLGLLLGFVGMLILLIPNENTELNYAGAVGAGGWAILLVIFIECIHLRIKKFLVHEKQHSPFAISLMTHGCACMLSLATIWWWQLEFPTSFHGTFYGLVVISALLGTVVCNNLYTWLLKTYSTTLMTYCDYLLTLCIALFSWLFFDQQPPWQLAVSGALTLSGLICLLQVHKEKSL